MLGKPRLQRSRRCTRCCLTLAAIVLCVTVTRRDTRRYNSDFAFAADHKVFVAQRSTRPLASGALDDSGANTSAKEVAVKSEVTDANALHVDYVVDRTWVCRSHARVHELAQPNEQESSNYVSRIVMPHRLQDAYLLKLLHTDQLRVELWPHRIYQPKLLVRVFTNFLQFSVPEGRRRQFLPLLQTRRQWLLLLEVVIEFPSDVSASRCRSQWRWAGIAESDGSTNGATSSRFRVLEVSCPPTHRTFRMLRPLGGLPPFRAYPIASWPFVFATLILSFAVRYIFRLRHTLARLFASMARFRNGLAVDA